MNRGGAGYEIRKTNHTRRGLLTAAAPATRLPQHEDLAKTLKILWAVKALTPVSGLERSRILHAFK